MNTRLIEDMEFCILLDKMKTIKRQTKIIGTDICEDDAQHSFHVAAMAMVLEKYSNKEVDIGKCVKMLIIHDVIEIYAGDTPAYDPEANKDKREREYEAMEKLFGQLDEDSYEKFKDLWVEFEEAETAEAVFANAIDRIQPILSNIKDGGGTWKKYHVRKKDVLKRVGIVEQASDELWELVLSTIDKSIEQGYIKED